MRRIIALGSSLPPVVCRRAHVLLMLFVRVTYSGVKHVLTVYMSNMVVSYKRQKLFTFREHLECILVFLQGSVLCICECFVFFYYVSLRSQFRVVISVTVCAYKQCSFRLYLQLFVGGFMCCLRYLCLLGYSSVQHILCYALYFVCFRSVLCAKYCQLPWIVHT